ncbi:DEAD/DEAH box helicase [Methanococcus aeolicus]|uniref:DEAD/DEAH box helicase n=1 Tax=Methanococcus aeolicus TaxID=42879 RepID=UPI0021C8E7E0|nr:DEAD/DEAH box helicase [Methanococcus aeolicus]UXM85182.1 DEAD/DEAH box helicase [Methanococcus aeolicus]
MENKNLPNNFQRKNETKVMNILNENGIKSLRPPQQKVLNNNLLDKNKNFLICIPTASGKTLIGEMAFINHLLDENKNPTNKKGLFIVPLKALATEKYEEFKEKYEKYGLKIGLSIGDFDEKENLNSYDLIITTAEKLDSLIRHKVEWIKDISVVIVDEIHLIGDENRGGTLEIILTKLKQKTQKEQSIQIIGLSATIGNPEELAKWLNAKLIIDEWRPVELKKGIYYGNDIQFIEENNKLDNKSSNKITKINKPVKQISKNNIFNLVVDCVLEDGSCLIFCNSKRGAVSEAKKLNLKKYLSKTELNQLMELKEDILTALDQPTETCKNLATAIEKGVAFHHAGLTNEQRKIVEDGFRKKLIKVICCTPTLSAGLNLPCRRAIVRDLTRFTGKGMTDIPKMEIRQCIGRAGRPNLDPYGEGIIYIKSEDGKKIDNAINYLIGGVEEIYSKLSNQKVLRTHILGLISTGEVKTSKDLENFIKNTFYTHQYQNTAKILYEIDEIVSFLGQNKFIECSELENNEKGGQKNKTPKVKTLTLGKDNSLSIKTGNNNNSYKITPLGKKISELYIDPLSAEIIINDLKLLSTKYNSNNSLNHSLNQYIIYMLYSISKTTEMMPHIRVKNNEENELIQQMMDLDIEEINMDTISYFKNAKIFYDWINEYPEDKLLKKYAIEPGILRYKVEQAKWMVHSAKEIFNLLNINNNIIEDSLYNLEIRIEYGAKEDIMELLKIRHIGRARARKLYNSGIKNRQDISNNPKKVVSLLGEKISKKIFDQVGISYEINQNDNMPKSRQMKLI